MSPTMLTYTTRTTLCRLGVGGLCCNQAASPPGSFDQSAIEAREDVLVYSTEPLKEPMEVTGPVTVTLYAASSAVDTDFTAKLVDACPCGGAVNLTDGIIRARYRESTEEAKLITPGRGLRIQDRPLGNEQPLQSGAQDPGGDFQQQLPKIRQEPQYGGCAGWGDGSPSPRRRRCCTMGRIRLG